MQRPEEVSLGREDGAALIERLEDNALTTDDRRVLVKLIAFHFWLLLALQEAKLSLKRLRSLLFGEKPKKRAARSPDKAPDSRDGDEDTGAARIAVDAQSSLIGWLDAQCFSEIMLLHLLSVGCFASQPCFIDPFPSAKIGTSLIVFIVTCQSA